jgi:transcriptional regulator with XRE-family HTH domain
VDNRNEIRAFLTSRRAKITPAQAGLPVYGGTRRVSGLRRGEVAMLAGVSVEYYTRLERGNLSGASESVLDALAGALQLDDVERTHLFDLARAANASTTARARRRSSAPRVRPSVQRILDSMVGTPALVRNNHFDVLSANALGSALYSEMFTSPLQPVNSARFIFLDPRSRRFYVNWERMAKDAIGALRLAAGKNPYDRGLTDLIGELSTRSDMFRTWWAAHDVYVHRSGTKHIHHPVVGELELAYEGMQLAGDDGLTVVAYSATPGSPSEDALNLLASWSLTAPSTQASLSKE